MARARRIISGTDKFIWGYIDDEGNRIWARLTDMTPLGYYDKTDKRTHTTDGMPICEGDITASLIAEKCRKS